jgi:hypothetical protein
MNSGMLIPSRQGSQTIGGRKDSLLCSTLYFVCISYYYLPAIISLFIFIFYVRLFTFLFFETPIIIEGTSFFRGLGFPFGLSVSVQEVPCLVRASYKKEALSMPSLVPKPKIHNHSIAFYIFI